MEKQKKLSKSLRKTTIQETVGSSFVKYLNATTSIPDLRAILNLMVSKLIKERGVQYIKVDDYINFYSKIPIKLWAKKPVFYNTEDVWDALGLIGERVHKYTLISKTLDLYFYDILGIQITDVMDNKEPLFMDIEDPKDRMIIALEYLKDNATEMELMNAYNKARQILTGNYNV